MIWGFNWIGPIWRSLSIQSVSSHSGLGVIVIFIYLLLQWQHVMIIFGTEALCGELSHFYSSHSFHNAPHCVWVDFGMLVGDHFHSSYMNMGLIINRFICVLPKFWSSQPNVFGADFAIFLQILCVHSWNSKELI